MKNRSASFSLLQPCGNVFDVMVSIFSDIISLSPGLFMPLCKAKPAYSNHQLAYLEDYRVIFVCCVFFQ